MRMMSLFSVEGVLSTHWILWRAIANQIGTSVEVYVGPGTGEVAAGRVLVPAIPGSIG